MLEIEQDVARQARALLADYGGRPFVERVVATAAPPHGIEVKDMSTGEQVSVADGASGCSSSAARPGRSSQAAWGGSRR